MCSYINNGLYSLIGKKSFCAKRASSYDISGGNDDFWFIKPGEAKTLAELKGPGIISHIWFTVNSPDKLYLRKLLLNIYWDNETSPSICSPLGDFFGLGNGRAYTYQCAAFSTSANNPGEIGECVGMNCWLPMPFLRNAKIEIINEQAEPVHNFYFYIDYQEHDYLPEDTVYLHALWRRENPCCRIQNDEINAKNCSDANNYLILEAEGCGHYIGVNMSIDHMSEGWWGEGDDMIFVDRDGARNWPPELHGTGSEDYLCHAWGMQKVSHLFSGEPWCELEDHHIKGKVSVYRYHILDPIPFKKNIRVSIEHGHANDRSDDYSSVAYWYQTEPHKAFKPVIPVNQRLPNV